MLAAPSGRGHPHTADRVEIRRLLHRPRSAAIEGFNGQFKAIFDVNGPVPTRGLTPTRRDVLGVVGVYQQALLRWYEAGQAPRVGLEPVLRAA